MPRSAKRTSKLTSSWSFRVNHPVDVKAEVEGVSAHRPPAERIALPLWGVIAAVSLYVIGFYWDISWHQTIGRDSFLNPAHVAIYLCGIVGGISCALGGVRCCLGWSAHVDLGAFRQLVAQRLWPGRKAEQPAALGANEWGFRRADGRYDPGGGRAKSRFGTNTAAAYLALTLLGGDVHRFAAGIAKQSSSSTQRALLLGNLRNGSCGSGWYCQRYGSGLGLHYDRCDIYQLCAGISLGIAIVPGLSTIGAGLSECDSFRSAFIPYPYYCPRNFS